MRITVNYKLTEDQNGKYLLIEILNRKSVVLTSFKLSLNESKSKLTEQKKEIVYAICKQFADQGVCEKNVFKEFANIDDEMLKVYKKLYPRGGSREGSGRKTDNPKTERFTTRCTPEEKLMLIDYLKKIRT